MKGIKEASGDDYDGGGKLEVVPRCVIGEP